MRIDEAAAYQDAFDALEAGTANATDLMEIAAVLQGLSEYLDGIRTKFIPLNDLRASMTSVLGDEKAEAMSKVLDGDAPLRPPRVSIIIDEPVEEPVGPIIEEPVAEGHK